jgi:hypothetical protein
MLLIWSVSQISKFVVQAHGSIRQVLKTISVCLSAAKAPADSDLLLHIPSD